jgi:hypothetical protein
MVEGNMGKFEVRIVISNPKENFCLNACVRLRRESIEAILDPSIIEFSFAKGLAKVKLGEAC